MLGEISLTGLGSQAQLSSQVHSWKVGQLLEAVAVSRPAAERLQLRIGGNEMEARTQVPIQPGDKVLLKVLSVGPTPTLQVVPATTAAANAAEVVNHAIRQLLPRQLATDKVIGNLVNILKSDDGRGRLPAQARSLIETLLGRIPRADKLADHTQLRQLVAESGLFRESRQLIGRPGGEYDLKQALIQLSRQLPAFKPESSAPESQRGRLASDYRPRAEPVASPPAERPGLTLISGSTAQAGPRAEPPAAGRSSAGPEAQTAQAGMNPERQLQQRAAQAESRSALAALAALGRLTVDELLAETRRVVEGGIARVVLQQAQSLPQQDLGQLRWVFELPYRDGDEYRSVPMVIEREAGGDDGDPAQLGWRVELAFEAPALGAVQARVLVRGAKVSAALWADRDSTAQLADAALPALETALLNAGLQVGALTCRHGQRAEPGAESMLRSILDCRV